eukprot:GILK01002080.1.p1 GENE.GILK01002080.1~~GILK01002080.1.p1  ORF type:complete len:346 (-),score=26.88 GILK01002080.1:233-1270(-)
MAKSYVFVAIQVAIVILLHTQLVQAGCPGGKKNSALHEGCHASCPCGPGLACQPFQQICYHSPAKHGDSCMAGYSCGQGLSCHPFIQKCYNYPRQFGEPCMAGHECGRGLSCQPGVHKCYHEPRLLGEPCIAGHPCSNVKTDYFNPRTKKMDGQSSLECKAFSHTCAMFPPNCPSSRQAACETCQYTLGFVCSAVSLLPAAIEKIGCGKNLFLLGEPTAERVRWNGPVKELTHAATQLASELGLNVVNNLIPVGLPGQINLLCNSILQPALNGACASAAVAAPACMTAVSLAVGGICTAIASGVKDMCLLATKYVFETAQISEFLGTEKCVDNLCYSCVSDGCFD